MLPAVLEDVHTLVLSPGLSPLQEGVAELLGLAAEQTVSIISEVELFALALADLREQGYTPKVFAISGTNGKTTVTALTRHMLEFSDLAATAAGNISPAAIQALSDAVAARKLPDVWVIELSSFQLHFTNSLHADAACVLNISQDHLDWHGSFEAYQADKARIFKHAQLKVVNRDDAATVAMVGDLYAVDVHSFGADAPILAGDLGIDDDHGMPWISAAGNSVLSAGTGLGEKKRNRADVRESGLLQRLMPADALRIRGQHNVLNALAALALCRSMNLPWGPLLHALRDYGGEPHRVEYVRTIGGVTFINDSKGTNVGATVAALNGFQQRLVLIAGGLAKGQDFQPLVHAVQNAKAAAIVLIGKDARHIAESLADSPASQFFASDMADAVRIAYAQASDGDLVLLSPACASMDMFENYVHRGNAFVSEVQELALENGEMA